MKLQESMERAANQGMEKMFQSNQHIRDFHKGEWMQEHFYIRHLIETSNRIPLMNETDAYAIYRWCSQDPQLAAKVAHYLSEEMGHELLFARDVERFGVPQEKLTKIRVFPSTMKLIGFLRASIEVDGMLPSAVWSWLVEWYSDRYNPVITKRAAEVFGDAKVKGSKAHIAYDEDHDHGDLMFQIVRRSIETFGSEELALSYIKQLTDLIAAYFGELYEATCVESPELCKGE